VPQFNTAVSQKTFFKGDKVQLKWNALGTTLIVLAQTETDKTGKSYYGETTLYVLSANGGFDSRITLDKEGPIHDVTWSPNSREFGVVYGYMPAKTTIFNTRAVATHSFPLGPRNTILFSPTGRFVLVAGFGNLAGQVDVYDLSKDYRKLTTIESGNPSVCEWSPDERFLLTATTSPRLRVDNGIRIFHVAGSIVYNEDMVELYHVAWRPSFPGPNTVSNPLAPVPQHSSAAQYLTTVKTPSKPAGAYRPPGARGTSTPLHFKREDEGGAAHTVSNGTSLVSAPVFGHQGPRARRAVPGAELVEATPAASVEDENLSKAALKNKKKREAKKAKEAEIKAGGGAPAVPPGFEGVAAGGQRANGNANGGANGGRGAGRNTPAAAGAAPSTPARNRAPAPAAAVPVPEPVVVVEEVLSPGGGSAHAKKLRGLQKKMRAIEELEMRLAGGERLEDTQMRKIGTKASVVKELEGLDVGV
jgi:translation initiation factor 2A